MKVTINEYGERPSARSLALPLTMREALDTYDPFIIYPPCFIWTTPLDLYLRLDPGPSDGVH